MLLSASSATCFAQEADSLFLSEVEEFTFEDSLDIFNLIDSILQYGNLGGSQLALRLGYNSNVLSAGRTLGIENFGIAPGISYYHKSGFYADVSGYWSKDFDPSYYLTITSVGYIHSFTKKFSFMAGYDRYFYNMNEEDGYVPYKNTLSVTPMLDIKPILFTLNYSFYFGDSYANRIMPGFYLVLEKKNLGFIDRIAISPSFFVLFGDERLSELEFIPPRTIAEARTNKQLYGTIFRLVETTTTVFGVMNYSFGIPLTITAKNWAFAFTYAYNIPKALPGEPLTLSESSYLSGSLTYFINFKRKKFPL